MNILLIYPEFPDTFWSFKHALKFVRKRSSSPPLGLLTVAAMLPGTWEKRLVDMNGQRLHDKDLAWADMIMISAMTVQRESTQKLLKCAAVSGKPIVAGGPLFTAEPDAFPEVDHLILNEAEITLPLFLSDLGRGKPQRVIKLTSSLISPKPLCFFGSWWICDIMTPSASNSHEDAHSIVISAM